MKKVNEEKRRCEWKIIASRVGADTVYSVEREEEGRHYALGIFSSAEEAEKALKGLDVGKEME